MYFEPLTYLWGTLTAWHLGIWLGLAALPTIIVPMATNQRVRFAFFPAFLWMLACVYGILGLVFGQLFGDKFSYLEIIPTGFLFGAGFMLLAVIGGMFEQRAKKLETVGCSVFALIFSGLFFGSCTWLFPRVIGFGLIDFPKYSWGVQL